MAFREAIRVGAVGFLLLTLACENGETPVLDVFTDWDTVPAVDGFDSPDAADHGPAGDEGTVEPDAGPPDPEIDPALATALQGLLDEHVAFSSDPGVTLTIRTDEGAWWSGAAGRANLADGTPMTPETAFRVGSNTKPVVAAAILIHAQEGRIDLDAPLTDYLPEYTEWSDIPVRLLLNMRSGLPDYLGILPLMLQLVADPSAPASPRDILEHVREAPRDFPPDTNGQYTNSGYLLLGLILEAVSGKPADVEIRERILVPLGMNDTYLDTGEPPQGPLADGYIDFGLAGPALGLSSSTEHLLPDPQYFDGLLLGTGLIHPAANWTAGSLVSTSRDMAVFMHALLAGDLLEPATLELMKETVVANLFNGPVQYGLGLQIRPTSHGTAYGHGGLNFGYQAATWFLPDLGITISHLHNFLLDAYDGFQDELVRQIQEGADPDYVPCRRPDDLFREHDTGPYLNLAFKGRVHGPLDPAPSAGNASFRLAMPDGPEPFTGIFPTATLGETGEGRNVTITAFGLPDDGNGDIAMTSIFLGEGLFSNLDEHGRKVVGPANPGDMFLMVARGWYREGSFEVAERFCYTAITDIQSLGKAQLCGEVAGLPAAGDLLRVFGTIPYLDDPVRVKNSLDLFGIPTCFCLGENGNYAACP